MSRADKEPRHTKIGHASYVDGRCPRCGVLSRRIEIFFGRASIRKSHSDAALPPASSPTPHVRIAPAPTPVSVAETYMG